MKQYDRSWLGMIQNVAGTGLGSKIGVEIGAEDIPHDDFSVEPGVGSLEFFYLGTGDASIRGAE
jgi:hypothetical protein